MINKLNFDRPIVRLFYLLDRRETQRQENNRRQRKRLRQRETNTDTDTDTDTKFLNPSSCRIECVFIHKMSNPV